MKRKDILQHCIDILYEQLIMAQIDIKAIEEYFKDHGESDNAKYELQEHKARNARVIDSLMLKIEMGQKMLREEGE